MTGNDKIFWLYFQNDNFSGKSFDWFLYEGNTGT